MQSDDWPPQTSMRSSSRYRMDRDFLDIPDWGGWVASPARAWMIFRCASEEAENRLALELGKRPWDIPKLREFLEDSIRRGSVFVELKVEYSLHHIGSGTIRPSSLQTDQEGGRLRPLLHALQETTAWKKEGERYRELPRTSAGFVVTSGGPNLPKDCWNDRVNSLRAREHMGVESGEDCWRVVVKIPWVE